MAAHAEQMFAVLGDPAIYEYENEPPPSVEWLRARFSRLESRLSPGGEERWLNWVIRNDAGLIGYVQSTVQDDGRASIAYVLGSAFWGRGLATRAVEAMIGELAAHHGVRRLTAVLKARNTRSVRLLERLGFTAASTDEQALMQVDADEILMTRGARSP